METKGQKFKIRLNYFTFRICWNPYEILNITDSRFCLPNPDPMKFILYEGNDDTLYITKEKEISQQISEKVLNEGLKVPVIGLGTYSLKREKGVKAMAGAIDAGYRLLDSAFNYENEGALGKAIRQSSVHREELLVYSKLPGSLFN